VSQESAQDNLEVEISTLSPGDDSQGNEAHPLLSGMRLSRNARARRIAIVASAFFLLVVVIVASMPTIRQRVVGPLESLIPTPTATLIPGSDRFYLETDVPWTRVSLDGQPVRPHHLGSDPPLHLARGVHRFEWRADPFQPQHCIILIPRTFDSSCSIDFVDAGQGPAAFPAQIIYLHESLDTLAPDQQQALTSAIQARLSGFSDTVQPGETALISPQGDTPARQPIRATFTLSVKTMNTPLPCELGMFGSGTLKCTLSGQSCLRLCAVPWASRQAHATSPSDWLAFVVVQPSWEYTREDGTLIAQDQPVDVGVAGFLEVPVLLRINWGGLDWHVQALLGPDLGPPIVVGTITIGDDPACLAAEDVFSGEGATYTHIRFVSGLNPAWGCLVEATVGSFSGTPVPASAPVEEYLVRCGEFLAVNDLAHQHMPYYSVADAYEQALARQLAALPGGQVLPTP
jgi:hypothetical protein